MEDAIEKYPAELSGGMRRRVSMARALVDRPPIVFYDSPTAGLDPVTSQTIITLILRDRDTQNVTSLLATHRVQDAFIPHNGLQGGYCTTGHIMSAIGLIEEGHAGDDGERIREGMSGNLCRCGAYRGIVEAVLQAQKSLAAASRKEVA
jgi:aerobic-type carbon monoxide dehydrogenase small subunit (CoxS/CutS family)